MKQLKVNILHPENVVLISLFFMFLGMFRLSALMSIGVLGTAAGMLWGMQQKTFQFRFNRFWVVCILFFVWIAITSFWSVDKIFLLERLRIKLPIFVFGVCGLFIHQLNQNKLKALIKWMSYILVASTLPTLAIYLNNVDFYNQQYQAGSTLPIPFLSHIRYGLMLNVALIWLLYLYDKNKKKIDVAAALYLIFFLHVLAVRSALLALYVTSFCLVLYRAWSTQRYVWAGIVVVLSIGVLFSAYQCLPSFRNKVNYTKWSIDQYRMNIKSETSDEGRLLSQQLGMDIAREHFWLGCGEGDLMNEMKLKYEQWNVGSQWYEWKMPHNEFIWTTAASGFIGCMLLLNICFSFIVWALLRKHIWAGLFMLTSILSMMVEQTIETQLGVTFFILPLMIFSNLEA